MKWSEWLIATRQALIDHVICTVRLRQSCCIPDPRSWQTPNTSAEDPLSLDFRNSIFDKMLVSRSEARTVDLSGHRDHISGTVFYCLDDIASAPHPKRPIADYLCLTRTGTLRSGSQDCDLK